MIRCEMHRTIPRGGNIAFHGFAGRCRSAEVRADPKSNPETLRKAIRYLYLNSHLYWIALAEEKTI